MGSAGEQVEQLLDAVIGVASDLRLPDVLRRIVESAARLVEARYGALGVLDEGGTGLAEFLFVGVDEDAHRRIGRHPTGKGVLGLLIALPEPVRLQDISRHPQSYGFPPDHPPMRSFLGVPIRVHGEVFGNLYLAEKCGAAEFTAGDEQIVVALAAAAGVAIEKARLYAESRRREQWLAAANAVTPALLAGRGPGEVLQRVASRARDAAESELAVVLLPADDGQMVVRAVSGIPVVAVGRRLPGVDAVLADALRSGDGGWVGDPARLGGLPTLGAVLLAPLALGPDPLGVLLLAGSRPFPEVDRRAAAGFAGHAALALEVARAHEDHRRLVLYQDRDRIARDLHDLVIQRLFAIGLRIQNLHELVSHRAELADQLAGFVADLDQTVRDIRRTIFALREPPEPPGPASLRAQLLRTAQDAARTLKIEPEITFAGPLDSGVPDEVRDDVLAALREALSNAARHARASAVHIEVAVDAGAQRLELRVRDDGCGVGPEVNGRGVVNMGDRAHRWGGRCVVESCSGGGTEVYWTVPLPGVVGSAPR